MFRSQLSKLIVKLDRVIILDLQTSLSDYIVEHECES